MVGDETADKIGKIIGGDAGIEGAGKAFHAAGVGLGEKPFQEAAELRELAPDDGCAQGKRVARGHFAQELGATVEIMRVRKIVFRVIDAVFSWAGSATEDAVGTEMDETSAPAGAEFSEAMRQQRVDGDAGHGGL